MYEVYMEIPSILLGKVHRYVPELTNVHKLSICTDRHPGTPMVLKQTCLERVRVLAVELVFLISKVT